MTEQCNRCRFWLEEMQHRDACDVNHGFGWCRRRPPRLIETIVTPKLPPLRYGQQVDCDLDALDLVDACKFASTSATDWCGEFERAEGFQI